MSETKRIEYKRELTPKLDIEKGIVRYICSISRCL